MAQGHGESFWNQVRWVDGEGRTVGATPFRFTGASNAWYEVTVETRAPQGAAAAVIQIGFDSPNLYGERQLRLREVTWAAQPDPPQFAAEGELISRPQCLAEPCRAGRISWQADVPEGTSVRFQVRSAADVDGGPGDWTPLAGPDGTTDSYFTTSGAALPALHAGHQWLQYRLVLATTRPAVTPEVREVRLGDERCWVEDCGWLGPDCEPPRLVDYAPCRTDNPRQPLVFSLSDGADGAGVDRHSVEVLLDGNPIAVEWQRAENAFRYELRDPLQGSGRRAQRASRAREGSRFCRQRLAAAVVDSRPTVAGLWRHDGSRRRRGPGRRPAVSHRALFRGNGNTTATISIAVSRSFARPGSIRSIPTKRARRGASGTAAADRHRLRVIIVSARRAKLRRDPEAAVRTVAEECRQPALLAFGIWPTMASHIVLRRNCARAPRARRRRSIPYHGPGGRRLCRGREGRGMPTTLTPPTLCRNSIRSALDKDGKEVADVTRDMKLIDEDLRRAAAGPAGLGDHPGLRRLGLETLFHAGGDPRNDLPGRDPRPRQGRYLLHLRRHG